MTGEYPKDFAQALAANLAMEWAETPPTDLWAFFDLVGIRTDEWRIKE